MFKFLPVALCLLTNGIVVAGIAWDHPDYFTTAFLPQASPDACDYIRLGINTLERGVYSRCGSEPYIADVLRTPVYPIVAGALYLLGRGWAICLAQIGLHVASCLVLQQTVGRIFGTRTGWWAALLFATDLMLSIQNFEAMSETLFVFLIVSCFGLIALACQRLLEAGPSRWGFLLAGLVLGLATLTRPTALYLAAAVGVVILAISFKSGALWRGCQGVLLMGLAALPLPALWIARNYCEFGVARLSTVDVTNYVYFVGAAPYQLRFGLTLQEAQAQIARELNLPPYAIVQNHWASKKSVLEMDNELRAAVPGLLKKYPVDLCLASLVAVGKASVSHNTESLASMSGREWIAPSFAGLARLQPEAFRRLAANEPALVAAFVWQLGHAVITLCLGVIGVWLVLRNHELRPLGLLTLAILAYFYLTITMFGFEAYSRCRAPVLPFLYVFAGLAVARILRPAAAASSST